MTRSAKHLLPATVYMANGVRQSFEYRTTPQDAWYMGMALEQAKEAYQEGDSPIGAVLVLPDGEPIVAQATEFRDNDLLGHAELNVIKKASPKVGRFLGHCTLYSTAEPCLGCAYTLDKGEIGMLLVGASRDDAPDFFRRSDTLDSVWSSTRRTLTVVKGLRRAECATLLTKEAKHH